ncbi:MAG: hypothetical protein ACI9OJ_003402 [Myxococcota bacterium]|jgi:hypothetical protein
MFVSDKKTLTAGPTRPVRRESTSVVRSPAPSKPKQVSEGAAVLRRRDDTTPDPAPRELDALTDFLVGKIDGLMTMATAENDVQLLKMLRGLVIEKDLDLPRFPAVGEELLRLESDSPQGGRRIAQLVAQDMDITGRVMQLASSALYGRPVRSLEHAVARLGVEMVRQVAVGVSIQGVVYRVPGFEQETTEARERAFRTGMAASRLATKQRRGTEAGEAFLAGLFHEVGLPLLYRLLSRLRSRTRGGRPTGLLISRVLRDLAGPLGLYYLTERCLPEGVLEAVRYNSCPHRSEDGNWLAWTLWSLRVVDDAIDNDELEPLADEWPDEAPEFEMVSSTVSGLRTAYTQRSRPAMSAAAG